MLLITGACGYIGSHFLHYFLGNSEQSVVAVDNLSLGHKEAISAALADRVHFYQCDIGDRVAMSDILQRHDIHAVVHFAASAYVGESQEYPFKYFHNNVLQSLAFFESLNQAGVKNIVFSSTCATYGTPVRVPIDENHPQLPINTYGVTKLMIEQALRALALASGWRYVLLRYFNAAGASPSGLIGESHATETHLIPLALAAALGKGPALKVFGNDYDTKDGTCIRDYVHVDDLADAHMKALALFDRADGLMPAEAALAESNQKGAVFNLGTSDGNSVMQVLDTVHEVSGLKVPFDFSPRRSGDPAVLAAISDRAKNILGWQPRHNLRSIIETALAWEKNRPY